MHWFLVPFIFSILFFCCVETEQNIASNNDSIVSNANWDQIWNDEFNGDELDPSKWNKLSWRPGWVNNELQAYTNRDTNIFLENGFLILQGLIEPGYSGTDYTGSNYTADYTSGRINTDNKFSRTYGRFDIRAKLPKGKGSWPAIWMLGESISSIGWPACGEIDIMEHVGFDKGMIHGSVHTEDYNHMYNTQKSGSKFLDTATDSFHVYSLEWSPYYLRYLIDGESFFFVYNDSNGDNGKWPFNNPHYIILNLAIGGDWGGVEGVSVSAFPMRMLIDYVRVYKQSQSFNDVEVTFQVDMKNENVSTTGIWLSGGNIGSGQPGGIQMEQILNSSVWKRTLILPPNSNYTFKYRNGYYPNSWEGGWEILDASCSVSDYNDRFLSIGENDTTLVPVCFGGCFICD